MKIVVERNDLFKAMGRAQSIVERRTTIPILANVLIFADETGISLRTTDLDIEVIDKVSAKVEAGGEITVSANTLYEILRKLPDGSLIELIDDEVSSMLQVKAGRSRFSLSTLPRDDFPLMTSSEYSCNFSIRSNVLKRLFDKTRFAMSSEETRYYLNGVFFHVYSSVNTMSLRAVATDGHRLARVDVPLPDGARGMPGVIIPRKTVSELRMLIDEEEQDVGVSISESKVRFSTSEVSLTSKVVDGTFPEYDRVIPKGNNKKLEVNAYEFAKSVDRVATISTERARAVKLTLSNNKLLLSVNSPESGAADEEMMVNYENDLLEIGFNAKYLQEIASQVDKDNAVFLFNSPNDPALMREGSDETAIYVVMPMRV
tara:strand:+ start:2034 stop:3152 length:1119 start_codon:yes stop_codon:yes gene_type:complete